MSHPGRPSRGRGVDPDGHVVTSAGRGAALVGLAVIVGLLIFAVVDDGGPGAGTPVTTQPAVTGVPLTNPDGTPVTNPDGTPATAPATTSETKAKGGSAKGARPNDQVVVQVLNGSGITGAASTRSNELKAKGYQTLPAGNAPAQRDGTGVQCKSGYEKEAEVLVTTLKEFGVQAAVEPLPDPAPSAFDVAANCYVILGK